MASDPQVRYDMIEITCKDFFTDDFPVKIDDIEVKNGDTIPTRLLLNKYEEMHPEVEFWFVMGTDLITNLHRWIEAEKMIN